MQNIKKNRDIISLKKELKPAFLLSYKYPQEKTGMDIDERDIRKFSWPGLFFVTGGCFLTFCLLLKLLNDSYPVLFFWVGIISVSLGIVSCLGKLLTRSESKQNN